MKIRYNTIVYFMLSLVFVGAIISCTDDDELNGGKPRIRYVRLVDPNSSDSLLVAGYQNNMVAIIGENLGKTEQVWFNDKKAGLSPTYVTNSSILTTIPGDIPDQITNKMALVFSNGDTLFHDFEVAISEPVINSMKSEYVFAGDVATIRGNFFYEPVTVTFTGGVEGTVSTVDDDAAILQVVVPEGAEPGPITITTPFGETESDFWFRDNRNIFISSDPFTGWWNESFVVSAPEAGDPPSINGNYIRVKQNIGSWSWLEVAGGPPSAMGDISKNIPDEAIIKPSDYYLKFEVNTMKPFDNNVIKLNVGLSNDFYNDGYQWLPPYDTKGEWQTVVIPLETVMADFDTSVSADGYYARILFHGPGDLDADISFDNFRVVPKSLD
ncbi:glycan-binding surface protein [Fulvivirga ligni]|uniref:glycan-binding surface protein n=1 Tax=Fulvivirga ligni TaxID=2904246 RepID=UPI001F2ACDA5|nr:glycan-binding surface protein [Fulvivirga ligni]UII23703.1 glycan-binding surface protein [Fulvivirga ligni]